MSEFMETKLLFPVSEERKAYNEVRIKYQKIAEDISDEFSNKFYELFNDMDALHTLCPQIASKYLESVTDEAIRDLIFRGITDINDEEFLNSYYSKISTWDNDFSEIDERYMEIILSSEQLDEYRTARRENRGKWVGGGFGLGGAIQGAAGAAAANLAIGAVHGVFNLVGKGITAIGNSMRKSSLYKDPETKEHLVNAVYKMVFDVHMAFVNTVNELSENKISGYITNNDENRAERLVENIKKGRINGVDARKVLLEAISMNPYSENNYALWLNLFGDSDGLLESTAQYYGIHLIKREKERLYLSKKDGLQFDTLDSCKNSLSILEDYVKEIGYQYFSDEKKDIIELAERLEHEHLQQLYNSKRNSLDLTTSEGCKSSLPVLESYAETIGFRGFLSDKSVIVKLSDKLEQEEKHELFRQKKTSLDFSNIEVFELSWPILESYAKGIGYNLAPDEKSNILNEIVVKDKERRTVNDVLYSTVEMAQEAARAAQETERLAKESARVEQQRLEELKARTVRGKVYDSIEKVEEERSKKKIGYIFCIGMFLFPPVSLLVLRKGYNNVARTFSIAWLLFALFGFFYFATYEDAQMHSINAIREVFNGGNVVVKSVETIKTKREKEEIVEKNKDSEIYEPQEIVSVKEEIIENDEVTYSDGIHETTTLNGAIVNDVSEVLDLSQEKIEQNKTDQIKILPSFDCNKASNSAEKLICSSKVLADADVKLSTVYKEALASTIDKQALKNEQVLWLRSHRDVCKDVVCMEEVYQNRISQLSK